MHPSDASAGNGNGNGNAYGLAAVFGVVLVPVAFIRAFLRPMFQIPYLMFTVSYNLTTQLSTYAGYQQSTLSLAVGYSWIDGHLFVVGSPGIGWEVVWKRFVVVAAGKVFVKVAIV